DEASAEDSEEEADLDQTEGQLEDEASAEDSVEEADSEDAEEQLEEEVGSEEDGENEEEPKAPALTPEEIAKSADEEAERALQEMMASFLTEFAKSGDEYRLTTEVIPEEEEAAFREETRKKDRERMLGKETDESLGLTRTESFQEQLKKALEAGGNYEEANQIIVDTDQFESPEEAARRTVMEANGLEYVSPEDAANLKANGETDASEEALQDGAGDFEAMDGANSVLAASDDEGSEGTRTGAFAQKAIKAGEDLTGSAVGEKDKDGKLTDGEASESNDTLSADGENAGSTGDSSVDGENAQSVSEGAGLGAEDGNAGEGAEGESDAQEAAESAESDVDIVEKLLAEPDIMERVEVMPRKLTEEERELFSYFANIPGISEQVSLALADIHNNAGDKTSRSGNVLIMGRQLSGKTRLADGLIRAACLDLHIKAVKIAKVIGEDLNGKDAAEVVDQMSGGFLLIEGAGSMGDEFVENLNKAMEFRTDDLIVILEDEKADMMAMLEKHPEFAKKFTSTIIVPVFTNDELVTFARTYANEQGYRIDEMGTLALYTMIGENQKDDEPMVVGKVKKMVDRAIEHARGLKITSFFRKNASADTGKNWLREKDFR
ncbi:MAG: hypothetical protein Q4A32_12220, partial [Lachnospiraceae bacterium]|nr:hypothetical protein [Lachnospiraceae bacterium]